MILMNDFKLEPQGLRLAMVEACERVINSGWYVLGKELETFEARWAEACAIPHTVGVGNGMDAIELALRSLDIGSGDEVITTPMTAFATVLAIIRSGATPVLADIDAETGLMSPASASNCVTSKTKAILLVHLYGQMRDMDVWERLCAEQGIVLIEDCAQSHLAKWSGKCAGSFGAVGAYSFYPTKNLGAVGDGGACVTSNGEVANRIRTLRNYGQSVRYHHPELGLNSRLDEIQAAILTERLSVLSNFTVRRKEIAEAYFSKIDNPAVSLLARPQQEGAHVYHLFVLTCEKRDQFAAYLDGGGIQTLIHYPVPVHKQPPCEDIRRDKAGLSCAETHAATCISIPCHPQMSDEQVQHVINVINAFRPS